MIWWNVIIASNVNNNALNPNADEQNNNSYLFISLWNWYRKYDDVRHKSICTNDPMNICKILDIY